MVYLLLADKYYAMKLSTTHQLEHGQEFDVLGVVRGNTVRAKHLGHDVLAGLKNLVGGEVGSYTELLTEAREEAIQRMVASAKEMGADGVVGVRFVTSSVTQGVLEMLVFGTAVKTK